MWRSRCVLFDPLDPTDYLVSQLKIAYVGNFTQRHCTEVHLAATLELLGHEVERIQENDTRQDDFTERCETSPWDMFLFTRTWNCLVTLDHLDILSRRAIPSVSYHLDLYVGLKREDGLDDDPFWRTDYVFSPDGDPLSQIVFETKGINHFYMRPGVFKPECEMLTVPFENDVCFVGGGERTGGKNEYGHSEWPYRGQLLSWLEDTYGERYDKYGYPHETVRNERLNYVYASHKVAVGDSLCLNFDHPYYWSDRAYETIGRGGFLIHPRIKGMDEEFIDGEHLRFYDYGDFEQLQFLIDWYLEHDAQREAIRNQGHEFVKENATYTNRLTRMLEIICP